MKTTMVKAWSMYGVLLLLLLVVGSGANGGVPERRFADPESASDSELASLCGSFHLLPVGSLGHARALSECLSLRHSLPEGANTNGNKPYIHAVTTARDSSIRAKGAKRPTPGDTAQLNAGAVKQTQTDGVITDVQHATEIRKTETDNADQQLANDAAAREAEWQQQLADQKANTAYTNDMAAIDAAKRQDVLDAQTVDIAKAKWTKLEETIADAKAKAASDPTVIAEQNVKIKDLEAQRRADEAQRLADEIEAMRDAGLADDAGKAARVKTRTERAHNRAVQAANRETALVEASRARRAAIARQQLLEEQDIVRAKVRAEIEGTEAALALRRKNRATAHTAYQKRIEAYNKEKAKIKLRREAFETAEEVRAKRLAKIQEGIDARLKAKVADDLRLANAVENSVSPRHRKQQKNEEVCTTDEVGCGRGQCLQDKNKPKSKRCRCQDDDDGKNCEHEACGYDLDDGTGKTTKQKGNMVNNECVRWKSEYRCPCDHPWRLDVACVKKVGFKEVQVADVKCKGLTKPENEYDNQICELCDTCSQGKRDKSLRQLEEELMAEDTSLAFANRTATGERRLADNPANTVVGCSPRFVFVMQPVKQPQEIRGVSSSDKFDSIVVRTREECQEECLKRDGYERSSTTVERVKLSPEKHCTWVFYQPSVGTTVGPNKCYIFFTGEFPDPAPAPRKRSSTSAGVADKADPSGFVGFVTYPRRWDLYREVDASRPRRRFLSARGLFKYYVHIGRASAEREGENTFVTQRDLGNDDCISVPDTVRENAQCYHEYLKTYVKGEKSLVGKIVDLPESWTKYGGMSQRPVTVTSLKSGLPYTYSVDSDFRVIGVNGVSSVLNAAPRGDGGFEEEFNRVNNLKFFKNFDAPFCAGHLVAYQHQPANFYFNYLMQHKNSNTMGCWYGAEEISASLVSLGCKLEYDISIDYDQNGKLTPHEMFAKLPPWARRKSKEVPTRRRLASASGTSLAYVNDEFKCHYRFRPYVMNLDFRIVGVVDKDGNGNAVTPHCANLLPVLGKTFRKMFDVDGNKLVSSRIFAYLLSKQRAKPGDEVKAPSTSSLKRFLKTATAAKKIRGLHDTTLSCYAETGVIAKFSEVELQFNFYDAFLGDKDNKKCVRMDALKSECPKWTMKPDTKSSHFGIVTTAADECITEEAGKATLSKRDGTNDDKCAKFQYNMAAFTFTLEDAGTLVDENDRFDKDGKVNKKKIDELIMGTIVIGADRKRCIAMDGSFTNDLKKCLQLRISYYNFPAQPTTRLRAMQETDEEESDNDSDEVDDEYCQGAGASEDVCEC